MKAPGEALIIRLWETLIEKGVGSLLKPWQIRREGMAQADVKRTELLLLANAERDAEAIRRGELHVVTHDPMRIAVERSPAVLPVTESAYVALSQSAFADQVRKEINVAKAVLQAEAALESTAEVPPAEAIAQDWLYRWRDYASSVSAEELQLLWGRVLAGEVKAPGTFSTRFLNFVHNLDRQDALLIDRAMPFVVQDFISRETPEQLQAANLTFSHLLQLQELGVLASVDSHGLAKTFNKKEGKPFRQMLRCHRHGLGVSVEGDEGNHTFSLTGYVVTSIGLQLARLGNFEANLPYLRALGLLIKSKGYTVRLGLTVSLPNGNTLLPDAETL